MPGCITRAICFHVNTQPCRDSCQKYIKSSSGGVAEHHIDISPWGNDVIAAVSAALQLVFRCPVWLFLCPLGFSR